MRWFFLYDFGAFGVFLLCLLLFFWGGVGVAAVVVVFNKVHV